MDDEGGVEVWRSAVAVRVVRGFRREVHFFRDLLRSSAGGFRRSKFKFIP